ncbi:chemotaxis protein CheA [Spirobacillus cienkowskii]|uniref:chemotaxis protein CheA n=1 Tax=Spirobacillus cienkowskii TaxID=495820 RepID=UPI0030CB10B9
MDLKSELLQVFKEESADLIERARNQLDGFFEANNKQQRFQDILRVIHTIKGNAGTLEFNNIKKYAHELETELIALKNNENNITKNQVNNIFKFFDYFESVLNNEINESENLSFNKETQSLSIQENLLSGAVGFFDEKSTAAPFELFKPIDAPKIIEKNEVKSNKNNNDFVRVSVDRIEKNFDIISEIFLIRNQMRYLVEQHHSQNITTEDFFQRWEILDNTLRKEIGELENISMSMRMTPIKNLLRRMEKTVRSYLDSNKDKDILVEIEGEDVEFDKKIIDSLAEPLIHLTRNAMDHGIETTKERISLGKSPQAIIKLAIKVIANEAILDVSDDGRGIDENKVLQSAIKKGLNVSHVKTKDDMIQLIFLPGFSTVDNVSDVSGRGIGMDAVKSYVESLSGNLSIQTEINRGTNITLRLPLGMSVVPVIIAKANHVKFAILNSEILELKKIFPSEIVKNGAFFYYKRDNEFIPCYNIEDTLFSHLKMKSDFFNNKEKLSICIIGQTGKFAAVQIGEFLENAEIVIKPYPTNAPKFNFVTGISILATGEPSFVISLNKFCEQIPKSLNLKHVEEI